MEVENDCWADLVPIVGKPIVYAYKYRKFIQDHWKKAQVKLKVGKPTIVVSGRAGVGKSVLASHYHGEANNLDWLLPRSSRDVEIKPISIGDWTRIVSVIPGQDSKERAKGLDTAFNSHDGLEGVIHVVDWGYTAIRDIAIQKEMIAKGVDSIGKLREQNLALELKDFSSIIDIISMSIASGRGPKWLVIAVNKIDLFEAELDSARQYYHPSCSGPFEKLVSRLYTNVGQHNLKVMCIPVCSMPEPFDWNGDETRSQIDSVTRQKNYLRSFVDNIALLQEG